MHPDVPKRGQGNFSTVISNHTGPFEAWNILCSELYPSFTPKDPIKRIPIASGILFALQSLFISRANTEEQRDALVQQIIDRQTAVEVDGAGFPPLCIFPEGTTTNGVHILPFKRGAFQGMRTVKPCTYKVIQRHQISYAYECPSIVPIHVLLLSMLWFSWTKLTIMPEFTPTPYMLEKHRDKGDSPWQIYAWCVRDAMCKYSGLIPLDERLDLKDKYAFKALMNGQANRVEING